MLLIYFASAEMNLWDFSLHSLGNYLTDHFFAESQKRNLSAEFGAIFLLGLDIGGWFK